MFALNEFVLHLDYDINTYLQDLIHILCVYAQKHTSRDVRYWALYSLQSTIATAQKKIIPYMNDLLRVVDEIIKQEGAVGDLQTVKGQALMCAGRLAAACGKDVFPKEALEYFTKFGLQCLQSDGKYELKETAFTYFSDLSVLIREEMAPIFPQVLNSILATMNAEDKQGIDTKDGKTPAPKGFSLDSDSDHDDELGVECDLGQVDEKAAAVNALGVICQNAPGLTAPRM